MKTDTNCINKMYVKNDTLTTRIGLHDKYSVNKYGFGNWLFDQYGFRDGTKVLELGCGTAIAWRDNIYKLPRSISIILSDFSPLMVKKAKDLLQDNPIFSFQQIDIQDIPYDDNSFDIVIANHMLYHVPDIDKALSEAKRVLTADGCFYASTLGARSLNELHEIYRKFDDKASFTYTENCPFTLENGFELLNKHFSDVEQLQYIDSLEVTDVDDLIAYIKSYNDIPDSINDELYRLVKECFVNGIFRISKEQGVFICTY